MSRRPSGSHFESFDETRLRRPDTSAGNGSRRKTGRLDDECASFVAADRIASGRRSAVARIGMTAASKINVSHAPPFAGEDHLVLLLDEVHATRVRVDEQASVSATAPTTAARLRNHDVRNTFRMRPGWFWAPAAAAPAPATAGDARQELRRRDDATESVEAADAIGIDADPVTLEARAGCARRVACGRPEH